ncbi:hypothetical protein CBR_g38427 [Chara braunii]|uniref:Uncharacterized protein n=1 Tax=Chara braunii TaxID=69332 RepID=A0A388JNP8_CHABU|nr:hypothetical protein CBR_g38427 [Chara braunii]|eukprot:GBG59401.1 hypothetical protein CBR_g38427 [Chara braunii]
MLCSVAARLRRTTAPCCPCRSPAQTTKRSWSLVCKGRRGVDGRAYVASYVASLSCVTRNVVAHLLLKRKTGGELTK